MSSRPASASAAASPAASAGNAPSSSTNNAVSTTVAVNDPLLYHQTIIPTQNITHTVEGAFTLPNANDLVVIRQSTLELWTLHVESGTAECIHSTPLFSNVYAAVAVPTNAGGGVLGLSSSSSSTAGGRRHGSAGKGVLDSDDDANRMHRSGVHYLALTSETGYVTLLRYELAEPPVPAQFTVNAATTDPNASATTTTTTTVLVTTSLRGSFIKVSEVCLGRSGARLSVPGAYMAVDSTGSALFISSLMRSKVVVPLRRVPVSELTGSAAAAASSSASTSKLFGGARKDDAGDGDSDLDDGDISDDGGDGDENGKVGGGFRPGQTMRQRKLAKRRAAAARAANGVLALCSPIEAHRHTVIYSVCALEGFIDNVVFAALEEDVVEAVQAANAHDGEAGAAAASADAHAASGAFLKLTGKAAQQQAAHRKVLVVYTYVPSLQQVQRTHVVHVPPTAHRLVAVPAAPCGPGGVLVCTDTELVWYDISATQQQMASATTTAGSAVFKCSAPLPRRMDFTETLYDPSIIAHALTCVANDFFLLLQDEHGDVFRVFITQADVAKAYDALKAQQQQAEQQARLALVLGGATPLPTPKPIAVINPLSVHYFDTAPPASAMVLFRKGFLFLASEPGALHGLYKITRNGYSKDADYVVKRIKQVRSVAAAAAAPSVKSEDGAHTGDGVKSEPTDRKRVRDDDDKERGTTTNDAESAEATSKGAADGAMPAPSMKPPSASMSGSMAAPGPLRPPSSSSSSIAAAVGGAMASPPTPVARVIAVYQPHRQLKHMVLVQSYPNTPAIVGFTTVLPSSHSGVLDDASAGGSGGPQQQPQVEVAAVAGRGSYSVLLHARYGYATKREGRFMLPTMFTTVLPLASTAALQDVMRVQQEAIAAATQSEKRSSSASRLQVLRRLAATASQQRVGTDRVLLCTPQGTSVFRIGRTVELDTTSGFVTGERTLAAVTLKYGSGYVQVTPRGVYVLAPPPPPSSSSSSAASGAGGGDAPSSDAPASSASSSVIAVQPTNWAHPHGKPIIAAAVTPTTVLLSFGQAGGIASFDFGLTGTQLQQSDVLPTFPTAQAVALLQPPASSVTGAVQGELSARLFQNSTTMASGRTGAHVELAAIATVAQEVYLVDPRKLREPLEKIRCGGVGAGGARGEGGALNSGKEITSVLLTYLGGGANAASGVLLGSAGAGASSSAAAAAAAASRARRLFCFIGHMDGSLTRCELDPATARVIDRVELTCGAHACQLIAGDGESVCYAMSGPQYWRCDVRDGVPKMVPWRFTLPQTSFARFALPSTRELQARRTAAANVKSEASLDGDEDGSTIALFTSDAQEELVIAIRDRELSLFSAQQTGAGASSLEYSFGTHSLPVAGRRVVQHPTRPAYFIVVGTEHRGYGMDQVAQQRRMAAVAAAGGASTAALQSIPLDSPPRSLGLPDHYTSTLQLYHSETNHVYPPYYFPEGDAVTCVTAGSFVADFGREPIVVVGAASQYTHGAGCGSPASWRQGWLRAFRCVTGGGHGMAMGGVMNPVMVGSDGAPVLRLEPLHNTLIRTDTNARSGNPLPPDYPSAVHICEDVGLLFVGMGETAGLRVYAWGQQQFLRKRHLPNLPGRIIAIDTVFVSPPAGTTTAATTTNSSSGGGNASSSPTTSGGSSSYFLPDLYRCPYGNLEANRRAREKQLLVICGTVNQSVCVVSLLPGGRNAPSFLLLVARDSVPRSLTCLAVVDERTVAVADRFGHVVFLRIPPTTRFGFSEPLESLRDGEVAAITEYAAKEQSLDVIACHQTGQLVTSLHVQPYDPSGGSDASLAIRIVYYATACGAVGSYIPFVAEEDGALAAYLRPLLATHMRVLLGPRAGHLAYPLQGRLTASASAVPLHNVVEGDLLRLYRQASTTVFSTAAKTKIEEELERLKKVEAARRRVLGLPPRTLPLVADLVAKQRALVTLPQ